MSQIAVVVENALEQVTHVCSSAYSPKDLANKLVGSAWQTRSDLFQAKGHARPHTISSAAICLANGLSIYKQEDDQAFIFLGLGQILMEVERNGHLYPFADIDRNLILVSEREYLTKAERDKERTDAILGSLNL